MDFDVFVLGTIGAGREITVGVRVRIAVGWHIYAKAPETSAYTVTALDLELPPGAKALGDWDRPVGIRSKESDGLETYQGEVVFLRRVKLGRAAAGEKVATVASWQACDEFSCLPPAEARRTTVLGGPTTILK